MAVEARAVDECVMARGLGVESVGSESGAIDGAVWGTISEAIEVSVSEIDWKAEKKDSASSRGVCLQFKCLGEGEGESCFCLFRIGEPEAEDEHGWAEKCRGVIRHGIFICWWNILSR